MSQSCWHGGRAATGSDGKYEISGLDPELIFTLLVVKDGYSAVYEKTVDPAAESSPTTVLKVHPPVADPSQVLKGKVVNAQGNPVRDVLVEQQGVWSANGGGRFGGAQDWIDPIAVSNERGEFEITYSKPAAEFTLNIQPRGMATKLVRLKTGAGVQTLQVTDGAVVHGRLLYNGKPVANAEVGLVSHSRGNGSMIPEVQIGTREDGTFTITNVPPGRVWVAYPKMESLTSQGIGSDVVLLETKDDGEDVNIGDINLQRAFRLRGKVVLTDGKPVPDNMHVTLSADRAWDSQIVTIGKDGEFEFQALPAGAYSISPGVKGYRVSPIAATFSTEALVNHDIENFVIRMEPSAK
jgi:hypothetical protein